VITRRRSFWLAQSLADVAAVSRLRGAFLNFPVAQLQMLDDRMRDALLLVVGQRPAHAADQGQPLPQPRLYCELQGVALAPCWRLRDWLRPGEDRSQPRPAGDEEGGPVERL
jgi:hypothetical protein